MSTTGFDVSTKKRKEKKEEKEQSFASSQAKNYWNTVEL